MTRKFTLQVQPWGQPKIEAHDMTPAECALLSQIITNRYMPSEDYQACNPTMPFIQGWDVDSGWVLVEFWSDDMPAIDNCVQYINKRFEAIHG